MQTDAVHLHKPAVNRYRDQITRLLRPQLDNPATAALAHRLVATATRYETARLCGHSATAARELQSYDQIIHQLGRDPLA